MNYIEIKDGKIVDAMKFKNLVGSLSNGFYKVTKRQTKRSNEQNRYYRALIKIISDHTGEEDKERIYGVFKYKFLMDRSGKFPFVRSTSDLSTAEFVEYVDKIKVFSAVEFSLNLPDPENFE